MFAREDKEKPKEKCLDCGKDLHLFELNVDRQVKIMKCEECGIYHIYSKDAFGNWKIKKATKDAAHIPKL
jgi:hypothetical protein